MYPFLVVLLVTQGQQLNRKQWVCLTHISTHSLTHLLTQLLTHSLTLYFIAVSGLTDYCPIFHFPPPPFVRPYVTGVTSQLSSII